MDHPGVFLPLVFVSGFLCGTLGYLALYDTFSYLWWYCLDFLPDNLWWFLSGF